MRKKILLIPLALLLAISLVAIGCAPPAPAPPAPAPPAPPAPAPPAPPAPAPPAPPAPAPPAPPPPVPPPAPPPAPEILKWRLVSMWGEPEASFAATKKFAENVKAMSNGRIEIECFSSGALMPYTEYFDAVRGGVAEIFEASGVYYSGKDPDLGLPALPPTITRDRVKALAWVWEHGGVELIREIYAKWDLFYLGHNIYTLNGESIVSTRPILTLADAKGLKIRAPEDWAPVWDAMGADVLTIPGAEVYTALATGLVEASDWSSPGANYKLGYHEIAPYYSRPGDYYLGGFCELVIGIDSWKELPDDLKAILLQAAQVMAFDGWLMTAYEDLMCMGLLKAEGAEMFAWEPEFTEKLQELYATETMVRYVKTDLGRRFYDSILEFMKEVEA